MKIILAVDLETTGLDPQFHEVTQIAAILLDPSLNEISRYNRLTVPEFPDRALSFRGDGTVFNCLEYAHLTLAQLQEHGLSFAAMAQELVEWISGEIDFETMRWDDIILLGQNTQFDKAFLDASFRRFVPSYTKWPFDYHVLSTDSMYMQWYWKKHGKFAWSLSQKTICKELEIDPGKAHNAEADVDTTVKIFKKLLEVNNG